MDSLNTFDCSFWRCDLQSIYCAHMVSVGQTVHVGWSRSASVCVWGGGGRRVLRPLQLCPPPLHCCRDRRLPRRPAVAARRVSPGPHCTRQRCSRPVCDRPSASQPSPFRPVKTASITDGGGFDGTERAGTRSDGRKQSRNSADGCGEDRASVYGAAVWPPFGGSVAGRSHPAEWSTPVLQVPPSSGCPRPLAGAVSVCGAVVPPRLCKPASIALCLYGRR